MAKIMLFIDGTWLYANAGKLSESFGRTDYKVDFGRLPRVLAEEVGRQLGATGVDVVRTYLFGSIATKYDPLDAETVARRQDFFDMLKEEFHYEVEVYPISYMGRRLRKCDRDPADTFEPEEKCVDISLATSMLYFAAIPYAYDIAIAVLGDQDFKPVLQHVRRLGKRIAIASIRGSCTPDYEDPRDEARVKDFDIIWLNDLLDKLELKYEPHYLPCESPSHEGPRDVYTTFHPRKGRKFYCDTCREEFARQREAQRTAFQSVDVAANAEVSPGVTVRRGTVKSLKLGYGFIAADDGLDYYFHYSNLEGLVFASLDLGQNLEFTIEKFGAPGVNGSVKRVWACPN